jgi:phosphoribosylformimino-5-aminoimidazole carboxamide ribotide isomerase
VILVPAIDIRGGRAVRLRQGTFDDETVYADEPLAAARGWVEAGARRLHLVDLDGARRGEPAALDHLGRIAAELRVPIQYGGGLRTLQALEAALDAGADRVILGTAAIGDPDLLDAALERYGDRVVVGVDARGGEVAVSGWEQGTGSPAEAVAADLAGRGVTRIVHTAIDRDGTLSGPDLDGLARIARAAGPEVALTCSGGIGSLEDLRSVAARGIASLDSVICGRALYERRFTVGEGQAALAAVARPAVPGGS